MSIRKLLLVHPSRAQGALIRTYILAEFTDIECQEVTNAKDAFNVIGETVFNAVICYENLQDVELSEFKTQLEESIANANTPLVILSDKESDKDRDVLLGQGFDNVVQIRRRPSDLFSSINKACNPRLWRKDPRYHFPNASVIVELPQGNIEAELINVSMGGMFVELTTNDPSGLFQGPITTSLSIPLSKEKSATLTGLITKLLRLEVVSWNSESVPNSIRATFIFVGMNNQTKIRLEELIEISRVDNPA